MKIIKQKILNLRKKLRYWEYLYYQKSDSKVSDEIYDMTLEELRQLESRYSCLITNDSPTQCIGNFVQTDFEKIYHYMPMLSLNSIFNEVQLLSFDERIKNKLHYNNNDTILYCCELKLDGVAVSLLYKQGELVQAATRGNGKIGESVINNVRTISSIPINLNKSKIKALPYLLEIRGEIFISKSCFSKLNQMIIHQGNKPFSNSRNAASGSLRQLDSKVTASRPLSFCCYGISFYVGEEKLPDSQEKRLLLCSDWGVPINHDMQLTQGINKVIQYYNYIKNNRSNLDYGIDGIVVKVDSCIDQEKLGNGSKAPNWSVAYKFPAISKFTKLNKVIFKVSRMGLIVPVAHVQPVVLGNVEIKKVNIYNVNEIKKLDLKIGDVIRVQRSGDVIPRILEVELSKRSIDAKTIALPKYCPECGSMLESIYYNQTSIMLRCVAKLTCLAQRKASLTHFASRKAINIRGMGKKVIDQLVDKNLVHTPIDLFYLSEEKLKQLDGYGIVSAKRLLRSIDTAKQTTFSAFIYALGIPNVGEIAANNLATTYKTIENLISADLESLKKVQYVGRIAAMNIHSFFRNSDNIKNIYGLISSKVGIKWDFYR